MLIYEYKTKLLALFCDCRTRRDVKWTRTARWTLHTRWLHSTTAVSWSVSLQTCLPPSPTICYPPSCCTEVSNQVRDIEGNKGRGSGLQFHSPQATQHYYCMCAHPYEWEKKSTYTKILVLPLNVLQPLLQLAVIQLGFQKLDSVAADEGSISYKQKSVFQRWRSYSMWYSATANILNNAFIMSVAKLQTLFFLFIGIKGYIIYRYIISYF